MHNVSTSKAISLHRLAISMGLACWMMVSGAYAQNQQQTPEVKTVEPQKGNVASPRPLPADVMRHWPTYPDDARAAGQEGIVHVKLRVTAEGLAEDISVARSSSVVSLDLAAVMAVSHWRFEPATREGEPVEAIVTLPIRFSLSDKPVR